MIKVCALKIKTYFKWIFGILMMSVLSLAFIFLYPLALSDFINRVETQNVVSIYHFFWLVIGVLILKVFSNYLSEIYILLFDKVFKVKEYTKLYDILFHVKYEKIKNEEPVSFLSRIDLYVQQIFMAISETIPNALISMITILVCLVIVSKIHIFLTMILICIFPIQVIAYKKINTHLVTLSKKLQDVSSKSYAYFVHIIQSFELIKQINDSHFFSGLIEKEFIKLRTITFKINRFASTATHLSDFLIELLNTLALFYAIYLYYLHEIPMASVFLLYEIKTIYATEVKKVVKINVNLRDLAPAIHYIQENVYNYLEVEVGKPLEDIQNVNVHIESFGFNDHEVLHHVFFSINKGEIIALNGESGKGKTTLVRLLSRFYQTNQIDINNQPIEHYSLSSFREKVYMVSQNPMFFNGTIKDNILCRKMDYDVPWFNQIVNSQFFSSIKDISKELVDGGQNISGGQKQMIALARMLIRKPELIILDESFANIDEEREKAFFDDFKDFFKDKIVIVITHRKSTLEKCMRMIYL